MIKNFLVLGTFLVISSIICLYIANVLPINTTKQIKSVVVQIPLTPTATDFVVISNSVQSSSAVPVGTPKSVEIVYYIKQIGEELFTCSGLAKADSMVDTVSHCLGYKQGKNEKIVTDSIPKNQILLSNRLDILPNQNLEFSIATIDKALVGAVSDGGCTDKTCEFFKLKAYKSLGQGNSGTPVFAPNGILAGHLSFLESLDTYSCGTIEYPNTTWRPSTQKRDCGYKLVITTTKEFRETQK